MTLLGSYLCLRDPWQAFGNLVLRAVVSPTVCAGFPVVVLVPQPEQQISRIDV